MGDDIRPPVLWRRPNAKTYQYNQEFGGSYYQPMIQYIETKNRQGVFFERPSERIHLPDSAETYMTRGEPRYLIIFIDVCVFYNSLTDPKLSLELEMLMIFWSSPAVSEHERSMVHLVR